MYASTNVDFANSPFVQGEHAEHALSVAGVMIGTSGSLRGIAPLANLHAGAMNSESDESFAFVANRIARLLEMRAINVSVGRNITGLEETDGNSYVSQFIDWSARVHDVLYVVGGAQETDQVDVPQDNFNGITVSNSQRINGGIAGAYRQVSPSNILFNDAVGDRTSIDIMAPGEGMLVPLQNNEDEIADGTSFAAPHVTGAVALLDQYGNFQESMSNPRFAGEHERHEVMKAILLNSADKLDGIHRSDRTIVTKPGDGATNWLSSPAYNSPFQSLDEQMGAGHLNVENALENYKPGKYGPSSQGQSNTYVPQIGWDYGSVGLFGSNDYIFNQPVGGYVAITLAWDRTVESTSGDDNYSSGDQFFNPTLNNLDIYLMPANSNDIGDALRTSTTDTDNLEHIFYAVPFGEYKIRVTNFGGGPEDAQDYALAWWAGEANCPGDFNGSGAVNGRDFLEWQRNPSVGSLSDWQSNYGTSCLTATNTAVPEPSSLMMLSFCAAACFMRRLA